MPRVLKKAVIMVPPEKVFDLVADVESFSRYSSYIRDVKEVSTGVYVWVVELLGMTLEWEAEVTDCTRPCRFAWRSTGGVFNRGSYSLKPAGAGTEITFEMEYRLTDSPVGSIFSPVLKPLIKLVAGELLDNIRKELEGCPHLIGKR